MCGLFASFNNDRIRHLTKVNSYRGSHTYSLNTIEAGKCTTIAQGRGAFDYTFIDSPGFKIGHVQAPTTGNCGIHPARDGNARLWHNGIIKTDAIVRLQQLMCLTETTWDTELLLHDIEQHGFDDLSNVDGSFACFYQNSEGRLYVFRNEISPLFYNPDWDFSSVKEDAMIALPANHIFQFDIERLELVEVESFETKENPYFFLS